MKLLLVLSLQTSVNKPFTASENSETLIKLSYSDTFILKFAYWFAYIKFRDSTVQLKRLVLYTN